MNCARRGLSCGRMGRSASLQWKRRAGGAWNAEALEARRLLSSALLDAEDYGFSSSPGEMVEFNGKVLFTTQTSDSGNALWQTDGTPEGTVPFALPPLTGVHNMTNVNGTLYFTAADAAHGNELWKSDGTPEGTVLVRDLAAGTAGSAIWRVVNVNGTVFFATSALWKTDGTPEGTVMVQAASSLPIRAMTAVGDTLYFSRSGALYKVGPQAVTAELVASNVMTWTSEPASTVGFNGTLYFVNPLGELWKSDGTAAGTVLVKHINTGGDDYVSSLVNFNGTLYFMASDAAHGPELWKSDGTAAGTVLAVDLVPGADGSAPIDMADIGGSLFFGAWTPTAGYELWKSDGTAAGTKMVKDIVPGTRDSYPGSFVELNGKAVFIADSPWAGYELWVSDGTAAGTMMLRDLAGGSDGSFPMKLTDVGGALYFTTDTVAWGNELWKTDGTAAGTTLVKDIRPGVDSSTLLPLGSVPSDLVNVNGTLFFTADDGVHGRELWKSDGTEDGTMMVKDIRTGATSSMPASLVNVGGTLFFVADDGIKGVELWKSDGTAAGTVLVKDIYSSGSSAPSDLTNVNGMLYFAAYDGMHGVEPWRSDGTASGTVMVADIATGSLTSSSPSDFTDVNGTVFFTATTYTNGTELWKTNGLASGTAMVKDIKVGSGGSAPTTLVNYNGTLYFAADTATSAGELWKSDGTAAGTVMVKSAPTERPTGITTLVEMNGTLYFAASSTTYGRELWRSDGTDAGTVLVKDINANRMLSSNPLGLINANGRLYFRATDTNRITDMWTSDGTEAGTVHVSLLGPDGTAPGLFTVSGGRLYFVASDGFNGHELWVVGPDALVGGATADQFTLRVDPFGKYVEANQNALPGSRPMWQISRSTFDALSIDGDDGGDELLIDASIGDPLGSATVEFAGGAGGDTLRFRGMGESDRISVDAGGAGFNAGRINCTGVEAIELQLGADGRMNLDSLSIGDGAAVDLMGHGVVHLKELALDGSGTFDLADNDLVLSHENADHGAAKVEQLRAWLRSALAGGGEESPWTGSGLTSSAARGGENSDKAIAVFNNDDGEGGAWMESFEGLNVDAGSIILKYTYFGDSNADGVITGDDFAAAVTGWFDQTNGIAPTWMTGDYNYDQKVTGDDFALVTASWFSQNRSKPLSTGTTVPVDSPEANVNGAGAASVLPESVALAGGPTFATAGKREPNVLFTDDLAVLA